MFKLFSSDIDGTLIDNVHPICEKNIEAISYLKEKNIPFVLCTGKSYAISKDFCKKIGADFGIFGNGSHCVDLTTNKDIFKRTLSINSITKCLELAKEYGLHIHANTETGIISEKLEFLDLRNSLLFPGKIEIKEVSDIYNTLVNGNAQILQLVLSSVEDLAEFKAKLQQVEGISITHIRKKGKYRDNIIDKDYEYLDISTSNVSKGDAVNALSSYLGISKEHIISIGDNINDISMFNVSGIGVAVNNAYDEVKEVADFVTEKSAKDGGFAEAIYKFI